MTVLLYLYIFMLGAALGSFALVVADRWRTKKSWVKGRSQCDSCKKTLQPIDLIPLFSWMFSRGKCRHCGKKVPKRYPLAELLSAITLATVFLWFPYDISLDSSGLLLFGVWIIIHTICMIIVLIDLKSMMMPYKFLLPLIVVAVAFRAVILSIDNLSHPTITSLLIGVLLGGGLFATLWFVSQGKWIGDSDVLLGVAIALIVGGAIEVWIAFVTASLTGLVYGLLSAVLAHKQLRHMKIPFGPFLVLGMVISLLFSGQLIDSYTGMFLPY